MRQTIVDVQIVHDVLLANFLGWIDAGHGLALLKRRLDLLQNGELLDSVLQTGPLCFWCQEELLGLICSLVLEAGHLHHADAFVSSILGGPTPCHPNFPSLLNFPRMSPNEWQQCHWQR